MNDTAKFVSDLSQQILKLWNEGDYAVLDERYSPGFVRYLPAGEPKNGSEEMARHVSDLRTQYPDLKITIVEKIFDGQTYASRWRFQGTDLVQTADWPVPPTGKKVDFIGTNIYHLDGGKIVDEYVFYDVLGVMQQMGLVQEAAESEG